LQDPRHKKMSSDKKAKKFVKALAVRLAPTSLDAKSDALQAALAAAAKALPARKAALAAILADPAWAKALQKELGKARAAVAPGAIMVAPAAAAPAMVAAGPPAKGKKLAVAAAPEAPGPSVDASALAEAWAATCAVRTPAAEVHRAFAALHGAEAGAGAEVAEAAAHPDPCGAFRSVARALAADIGGLSHGPHQRLAVHASVAAPLALGGTAALLAAASGAESRSAAAAAAASSIATAAAARTPGGKRARKGSGVGAPPSGTSAEAAAKEAGEEASAARGALTAWAREVKAVLVLLAHRRMATWVGHGVGAGGGGDDGGDKTAAGASPAPDALASLVAAWVVADAASSHPSPVAPGVALGFGTLDVTLGALRGGGGGIACCPTFAAHLFGCLADLTSGPAATPLQALPGVAGWRSTLAPLAVAALEAVAGPLAGAGAWVASGGGGGGRGAALSPAAAVRLLGACRWCLDLAGPAAGPAATPSSSSSSSSSALLRGGEAMACRGALRRLVLPRAATAWLAQSDAELASLGPSAPALALASALPRDRWLELAANAKAAFAVAASSGGGGDDGSDSNSDDEGGSGGGEEATEEGEEGDAPLFFFDKGGAAGSAGRSADGVESSVAADMTGDLEGFFAQHRKGGPSGEPI